MEKSNHRVFFLSLAPTPSLPCPLARPLAPLHRIPGKNALRDPTRGGGREVGKRVDFVSPFLKAVKEPDRKSTNFATLDGREKGANYNFVGISGWVPHPPRFSPVELGVRNFHSLSPLLRRPPSPSANPAPNPNL